MLDGMRSSPGTAATSRRTAYLLLVLLTLVWGIHWPVVKAGLSELPPFTYGAFRVGSALLVVALLLALRGRLRFPDRADIGVILLVGLGQIGGSIVLINLALEVVPAGRSSVLAYTSPFWAALVLASVLGVRVGRRVIAGIALGLIGVTILLNPTVLDWEDPGEIAGSLALLGSAALTAVSVVAVRYHRWHSTPLEVQSWQLLVALIPIALLAVALESPRLSAANAGAGVYILYSGPLATAFAFWASQAVARVLSPTLTTMGMLATPIVGLVASSILLGERISAADAVGFGVTMAGIAIVAVADIDREPAGAADELAVEGVTWPSGGEDAQTG
jgi:drug/metabolite transporter (DMT)-like permease